jgi:hypothetical protein
MLIAGQVAGVAAAKAQDSVAVEPARPIASAPREYRIALVIGNAAYPFSPLTNPINDARAVSEALKELGFQVRLLQDATLKEMSDAAREFGDSLQRGGVGLFYYAGHGMQIKGRNFLIPVGADIRREDEVAYNAFDPGLLLEKMEAARSSTNIVILDACRNNPFVRSFRSSSQGLAQMDAPVGSYLAFATAPAKVASDGKDGNGLYTQHLLEAMRTPGLKIEEVFKRVRIKVMADSKGQQIPWDSSSLAGDFYFIPPESASAQVSPAPMPPEPTEARPPVRQDEAMRAGVTVPHLVPGSNRIAEDKPGSTNAPATVAMRQKPVPAAKLDRAPGEAAVALYKKGMDAKAKGDLAAAAEAFANAADTGHPGAAYEMGLLLKIGRKPVSQDLPRAQRLFLAAAELGNAQAQFELAQMFAQGLGVATSCSQATKWALKSAQAGSADAAVLLGELYRVDCGGAKNPAEAARWLRVAADKGMANAQFSLGVLYMNGDGVPKDAKEARNWLSAAAGKGNTSARFYLDRLGN